MRSVRALSDEQLAVRWLACEHYINDPEPGDQAKLQRAVATQLVVEQEQQIRDVLYYGGCSESSEYGLGYMQNRGAI